MRMPILPDVLELVKQYGPSIINGKITDNELEVLWGSFKQKGLPVAHDLSAEHYTQLNAIEFFVLYLDPFLSDAHLHRLNEKLLIMEGQKNSGQPLRNTTLARYFFLAEVLRQLKIVPPESNVMPAAIRRHYAMQLRDILINGNPQSNPQVVVANNLRFLLETNFKQSRIIDALFPDKAELGRVVARVINFNPQAAVEEVKLSNQAEQNDLQRCLAESTPSQVSRPRLRELPATAVVFKFTREQHQAFYASRIARIQDVLEAAKKDESNATSASLEAIKQALAEINFDDTSYFKQVSTVLVSVQSELGGMFLSADATSTLKSKIEEIQKIISLTTRDAGLINEVEEAQAMDAELLFRFFAREHSFTNREVQEHIRAVCKGLPKDELVKLFANRQNRELVEKYFSDLDERAALIESLFAFREHLQASDELVVALLLNSEYRNLLTSEDFIAIAENLFMTDSAVFNQMLLVENAGFSSEELLCFVRIKACHEKGAALSDMEAVVFILEEAKAKNIWLSEEMRLYFAAMMHGILVGPVESVGAVLTSEALNAYLESVEYDLSPEKAEKFSKFLKDLLIMFLESLVATQKINLEFIRRHIAKIGVLVNGEFGTDRKQLALKLMYLMFAARRDRNQTAVDFVLAHIDDCDFIEEKLAREIVAQFLCVQVNYLDSENKNLCIKQILAGEKLLKFFTSQQLKSLVEMHTTYSQFVEEVFAQSGAHLSLEQALALVEVIQPEASRKARAQYLLGKTAWLASQDGKMVAELQCIAVPPVPLRAAASEPREPGKFVNPGYCYTPDDIQALVAAKLAQQNDAVVFGGVLTPFTGRNEDAQAAKDVLAQALADTNERSYVFAIDPRLSVGGPEAPTQWLALVVRRSQDKKLVNGRKKYTVFITDPRGHGVPNPLRDGNDYDLDILAFPFEGKEYVDPEGNKKILRPMKEVCAVQSRSYWADIIPRMRALIVGVSTAATDAMVTRIIVTEKAQAANQPDSGPYTVDNLVTIGSEGREAWNKAPTKDVGVLRSEHDELLCGRLLDQAPAAPNAPEYWHSAEEVKFLLERQLQGVEDICIVEPISLYDGIKSLPDAKFADAVDAALASPDTRYLIPVNISRNLAKPYWVAFSFYRDHIGDSQEQQFVVQIDHVHGNGWGYSVEIPSEIINREHGLVQVKNYGTPSNRAQDFWEMVALQLSNIKNTLGTKLHVIGLVRVSSGIPARDCDSGVYTIAALQRVATYDSEVEQGSFPSVEELHAQYAPLLANKSASGLGQRGLGLVFEGAVSAETAIPSAADARSTVYGLSHGAE